METIAIVGAGPYGLSIAAHLHAAGIESRIFGKPMTSWSDHMPDGMFLKSSPAASSLSAAEPGSTLADYCRLAGTPEFTERDAVPVELFVDYGRWFQQRHVPHVEAAAVEHVAVDGSDFRLRLSTGDEIKSAAVVVASGHLAHAYVPPELLHASPRGPAADAPISHASQHSNFVRYAGRRVIVVGSGQSALESAALLAEAGANVDLVARSQRLLWADMPDVGAETVVHRLLKPSSDLGPGWSHRTLTALPGLVRHLPPVARLTLMRNVLGPSGSFWLRDRFEGHVNVRLGTSVRAATALPDGGIRLELESRAAGREVLEGDHVLAGTGYRIDVSGLGFLDAGIRTVLRRVAGAPDLDGTFQSSVRGLYFTGLMSAPTFGPYLRFVAGTRFAGPRIASSLAARAAHVAA